MPPADFDPESVATVQRARLQSANARARLERARQLFEQTPPLISTQEFADLETAYQVSQQDYEVARIEARTQLAVARTRAADLAAATVALRETTIVAPALTQSPTTQPAGPGDVKPWAVSERLVSIGEYVQVGAPLFRIVADSPIRFRGSAPERYVGRIATGQRVQLRIEGSEAVEGVVTRVSPTIDVATRTFVIEAQIANAERRIRPGGFARASVEIGLDRDVPVVPASAVRTFAGISRVFVIDQGKARSVAVTVRTRLGDDMLAVTGALTPGAEVAVSGIARLSDGAAVTAQATASRE
jgi:multidrug efflux pump subunit AcrA (membrane-fusion protein)